MNDRGLAGKRPDRAVLGRRAFEQPQRGRADRHDRGRRRAARIERRGRRVAHAATFGMHPVAGVSSALTGRNVPAPTCSVTLCSADAARVRALRHQLVGEMQARRRRRDRAFVAREHGLVVGAVLLVGGARGDAI